MGLLTNGNSKLGKRVYSFSIPAIKTCGAGMSKLCSKLCYAEQGFYQYASVRAALAKRWKETRSPRFVENIIREIKADGATTVRIHASGDFYSAAYVDKWIAIAKACPQVVFYAYTRSWRKPTLRSRLLIFAFLQNVHLWYSEDVETGRASNDPGVRHAYMLENDNNRNNISAAADLIFRVKEESPIKRFDDVLICPYEQGIERKVKMTCSACKICFSDPRLVSIAV
jgi:hypothetical protein